MEKKKKKIIVISIICLLLVTLLLLSLTYAYYRTRIIGNNSEEPSISVQSKNMEIIYEDGSSTMNMTGNIEPGFTATKNFSVQNTGDTLVNYNVVFDNVVNEYGMFIDWVYTLEYGEESVTGYVKKSDEQVVLKNISIAPGEKENFKLTVLYKETDIDQSYDMGKSLSLRVNITDSPIIDAISKTGDELLATVDSNKTITLTENTILTTLMLLDDNVDVLDLNGYTLILNPTEEGSLAYIESHTTQEIKNGTIIRGENLTKGSLVFAYGSDLTINNVLLDGNMVNASAVLVDSKNLTATAVNCQNCRNLKINNSVIKNNYGVGQGLGVRAYGNNVGTVNISNSEIRDNYLEKSSASAIYAFGVNYLSISNAKILNNIAEIGTGTVNIENCANVLINEWTEIKYNVATSAGGIRLVDSTAIIFATIQGNIARASDGNGGGVYTLLNNSNHSITLLGNIINNISGGSGGGVYVNGPKSSVVPGEVFLSDGMITGNIAIGTPSADTLKDGGGAGIYVSRGRAVVEGPIEVKDNISMSNIGNAILLSHANGNINGGYLRINKNSGTIIVGSIKVHERYGTLDLEDGVTQNGDVIS